VTAATSHVGHSLTFDLGPGQGSGADDGVRPTSVRHGVSHVVHAHANRQS